MKKLFATLVLSLMVVFSTMNYSQTLTTSSEKEGFTQFSWTEASIDSAGADTSGYLALNEFLTGNNLLSYPFNFWYNITVAGSGAAADSVSMLLIFDGQHNGTWAALDTVTLDVSGTSTAGVQMMNFNNWRSPDNKYRIRAAQKAGGSPVTAFKVAGIVIKPQD